MIIKIYDDGTMAEIVVNPTAKPVSAATLVRVMTMNGIAAAKIIKSKPATGRPGTQCRPQCEGNLSDDTKA